MAIYVAKYDLQKVHLEEHRRDMKTAVRKSSEKTRRECNKHSVLSSGRVEGVAEQRLVLLRVC